MLSTSVLIFLRDLFDITLYFTHSAAELLVIFLMVYMYYGKCFQYYINEILTSLTSLGSSVNPVLHRPFSFIPD